MEPKGKGPNRPLPWSLPPSGVQPAGSLMGMSPSGGTDEKHKILGPAQIEEAECPRNEQGVGIFSTAPKWCQVGDYW